MTGYAPGAGDVRITLGGVEYVLRPTLSAALTVSRLAGGIRGAITRANDLDLDIIVSVIRAGVAPADLQRLRNLEEVVWSEGLLDRRGELVLAVVDYLMNLTRGGRPADASDAAPDSGGPTTPQQ